MKRSHRSGKADPLQGKTISYILRSFPDRFAHQEISIAELRDALSDRAYGILLLVLALPNLIPLPAPGLSLALGAPLVLFTFQLMLGVQSPWFPQFIARRRVKHADLKRLSTRVTPYIEKLEVIFRPRLQFLANPPADRIVAFVCMILSLMILMPIPFGNALPALAICFFALGILQNDGLFILLGFVITLAGATTIVLFLDTLFMATEMLFGI